MKHDIINADALESLTAMPDDSFDASLCDPPYGWAFMGRAWDHGVPSKEVWSEVLRVLKPGGFLLAFGGMRTEHRLTCAIEDAGFEIRDKICWLFGSGFPKSLSLSKAIDRAAGKEREVVSTRKLTGKARVMKGGNYNGGYGGEKTDTYEVTVPATPLAKTFDGYGTALKPAVELICVAMKPLDGTFANNAAKHGLAGLNIDNCRIGDTPRHNPSCSTDGGPAEVLTVGRETVGRETVGRWPANVILTIPEDSYRLRDDVTPDQLRKLAEWMDENTQ